MRKHLSVLRIVHFHHWCYVLPYFHLAYGRKDSLETYLRQLATALKGALTSAYVLSFFVKNNESLICKTYSICAGTPVLQVLLQELELVPRRALS